MVDKPVSMERKLFRIFNYVGAAFVFFGISYFIYDNWEVLNTFTKIFSTLGAAVAAYVAALLMYFYNKESSSSSAFFMIAGLVLPIGLFVTLNVYGYAPNFLTSLSVFTICFLIFLISQIYFKRNLLLFFSILFATLFFVSFISYLISKSSFNYMYMTQYELMGIGLTYLLLGRYLDIYSHYTLTGPLYLIGGFFLLAASFSLGAGFVAPDDNAWRVITGLLIFLAFILSIPLKSKSLLYLGSIFLVCYVIDLSAHLENVFGHLGWPFVLILFGFLLMLMGYGFIFIYKKIR